MTVLSCCHVTVGISRPWDYSPVLTVNEELVLSLAARLAAFPLERRLNNACPVVEGSPRLCREIVAVERQGD